MFIQILYFDVHLNISLNKLAVFASMYFQTVVAYDIDGRFDAHRI